MTDRDEDSPDHRPGFWLPNPNTRAAYLRESPPTAIRVVSARPQRPHGAVILWKDVPPEQRLTSAMVRYLTKTYGSSYVGTLLTRVEHPERYCPASVDGYYPIPGGPVYAPCSVPAPSGRLCTSHRQRLEGRPYHKQQLRPGQWNREMRQLMKSYRDMDYADRADAYLLRVLRTLVETLGERAAEVVWV